MAAAPLQQIVTRPEHQVVVAADRPVVAGAAVEEVVVFAAAQRIVAVAAEYLIKPPSALDIIVAGPGIDDGLTEVSSFARATEGDHRDVHRRRH